jgi:hypothetical protein
MDSFFIKTTMLPLETIQLPQQLILLVSIRFWVLLRVFLPMQPQPMLLSLLPITDHSLSHKMYGLNSDLRNTPLPMILPLDVVHPAAPL